MSEAFRYLVSAQPGIHGEATGHLQIYQRVHIINIILFIYHPCQSAWLRPPSTGRRLKCKHCGCKSSTGWLGRRCLQPSNVIFIFSDFFNFPFHLPWKQTQIKRNTHHSRHMETCEYSFSSASHNPDKQHDSFYLENGSKAALEFKSSMSNVDCVVLQGD